MLLRVILGGLLFNVVVACSSHMGVSRAQSDSLIVARNNEFVSLNPLYLEGPEASDICALGYSFLTNYDARGAVIADAARRVPTIENGGISRDGKRIIYQLRHDVTWQDGYPLTARDVVFTYRAIMNRANFVPSRSGYDHIAAIWAPDRYTVTVELTRPQAAFVTSFFGGDSNYAILPAHLLARYPNLNHVAFNELPIGSGPYRFTKWVHGERLDLTANDRYYGAKPHIRRLSIRFVHDSSTIVNELATNEVNATFFASPAKITALRALPRHRVAVTLVPYFGAMVFNTTDPLAGNQAIRRALASAIDRRALVAKNAFGLYDADTGARGMFTWAFDPRAGNIAYDPARARTLLAREGWVGGADGIRSRNGRRLEMQLIFSSQSFVATGVVPMLIDEARAVGIDLAVRGYYPGHLVAVDGPLYQGRFQVALMNYQNGMDPDPTAYLSCGQRAPNGFNWARVCSEAIDRVLDRGRSVYDRADRRRVYGYIQQWLLTNVPYYFLWQSSEIDVIPSSLRGYEPSAVSPYRSVARWKLQA